MAIVKEYEEELRVKQRGALLQEQRTLEAKVESTLRKQMLEN